MRAPLLAPLLLIFFAAGCSCGTVVVDQPPGSTDAGPGSSDAGPTPDGGDLPDAGGPNCGSVFCEAPRVCRFDMCIDAPAPCTDDAECQNDSYCEAGECLPYGVGPRPSIDAQCKRLVVLGLFQPTVQCEWTAPPAADPFPGHRNVLSTPLVADFNFDNDPATVKPSIVFVTYNCDDGSCGAEPGCYGVVRVVDGETCAQQHSFGGAGEIIGSVTPAIGDIDGDGRPDIVTERQAGGVVAYRYDSVTGQFVSMWSSFSSFNAGSCHWSSVALHDLDDDGNPEIVQNGPFPAAYDAQGVLIDGAQVNTTYSALLHPVLADLDADGAVEMVDGRDIWRFNPTTRKWEQSTVTPQSLGHTALADFGTFPAQGQTDRAALDGTPEIAVVTNGTVRVQTTAGTIVFGPLTIPGGGSGGAPTVADFDGDGRVEFGVAGATRYTVFDPDCAAGGTAATCASGTTDGMLWSVLSQDQSSNVTGSSVFDFEADGKAEVVYADECFSRVYDGRSGEILFSQHHTSCTWYENPIVADVDGDFRSEIVIPSNQNCSVSCPSIDPIHAGLRCDTDADCPAATACAREQPADAFGYCRCVSDVDCGSPGNLTCVDPPAGASAAGKVCRALHPSGQPKQGIQVISDVLDRWVGSRPIWNQHAYSVTHVNDDGTIPKTSAVVANWKDPKLNNFRQNVQGSLSPESVPDLTTGPLAVGQLGTGVCLPNAAGVRFDVRVCNRGTGPVASGVPVTFYDGPVVNAQVLCTKLTQSVLQPGNCETVSCEWPTPNGPARDINVRVDDSGAGQGGSTECEEANNLGVIRYEPCSEIG